MCEEIHLCAFQQFEIVGIHLRHGVLRAPRGQQVGGVFAGRQHVERLEIKGSVCAFSGKHVLRTAGSGVHRRKVDHAADLRMRRVLPHSAVQISPSEEHMVHHGAVYACCLLCRNAAGQQREERSGVLLVERDVILHTLSEATYKRLCIDAVRLHGFTPAPAAVLFL